jgi:hypothetical protein
MTEDTSNDNEVRRGIGPEDGPSGEAALLLVESLLHGLVAREVISVEDAIEFVSIATEVKEDIARDGDHPTDTAVKALSLLEAIRASLEGDLPR